MRMRITKRIIKKLLIDLAKEYQVRLHFNIDKTSVGSARYWNNSISVNTNQSALGMLSTFFHEMGHIYCWNNSLWKSFHINKPIEKLTKNEKRKYILTALKTERWVDNWGKKEMSKHSPHLKYMDGYLSKESGKEFTKEIKKELRYE